MYSVYILRTCSHLFLTLLFLFFYFLFLCPFPSFLPCFLSPPLSLFPFSSFSFFFFISLSLSPSPLFPSPSLSPFLSPSFPPSLSPSLPLSIPPFLQHQVAPNHPRPVARRPQARLEALSHPPPLFDDETDGKPITEREGDHSEVLQFYIL